MKKPGRRASAVAGKPPTKTKIAAGNSLENIYEQLKAILAQNAPPLKFSEMRLGSKRGVQLVTPKPVVIPGAYGGKPVDAQLAAAILQKDFVGFYFMCMYLGEGAKKQLSPSLLKLLKGKACFHVKALDEGLKQDIEAALSLGTRACRERGWL